MMTSTMCYLHLKDSQPFTSMLTIKQCRLKVLLNSSSLFYASKPYGEA